MSDNSALIELDRYERGAVLAALNDERTHLIEEGRPTDTVDEVLVKVAHAPIKKHRDRDEAR